MGRRITRGHPAAIFRHYGSKDTKDRNSCDLIVIGASSDGVEALRTLASHLPRETGASENELLEEAEKARAMLAKYAICFARQKKKGIIWPG